MRSTSRWVQGVMLMGVGYCLGVVSMQSGWRAWAQNEGAAPASTAGAASEDATKKIVAAYKALEAAREALEGESLYIPATKTLNVFGTLSGGVDAMSDLESGRGVDPETFAALYAGQAKDELVPKLSRDEENRLLYNGKLIQMYPISRLKKLYDSRAALTGEKPSKATGEAPAGEKPAEETPAEEKPAEEKSE